MRTYSLLIYMIFLVNALEGAPLGAYPPNLHATKVDSPTLPAITLPAKAIPTREAVSHMTREQKEARINEIKARVEEIKAMDKSTLTREERKALRKELRGLHKEARVISGVYISVGALIIIILLLIIIIR